MMVSIRSFSLSLTICIFSSNSSASGRVSVFGLEPSGENNRVTKIQHIEEDVDMTTAGRIVEEHASMTEKLGDGLIFLVAQLCKQAADVFQVAWVGSEVDVGELTAEIVLDVAILRAMSAKSQSAQQAQEHVAILAIALRTIVPA